jgi:cell division septation protein DedD
MIRLRGGIPAPLLFGLLLGGLGAFGSLAAPAAAGQEAPVVFALDSSRSLSAAESRDSVALVRDILAALPASGRPGILVFDDSVRWLVRPGTPGSPAELSQLEALSPAGRFTLLNDALIEGVRTLAGGGVLVLISDGRDEDSATTLEDAARLASDRGVRLVTVGAGRADDRTLRRLALLTGGLYAGRVGAVDASDAAQGIGALRESVSAERAARAPEPARAEAPATAPAGGTGAPSRSSESPQPGAATAWPSAAWLLPVGAALAATGIVLGFLLARRRAGAGASSGPERDTRPGVQWPASAPAPLPSPDAAAPFPAAASLPAAAPSFPAPQPINEIQIARTRLRTAVRPQGLMEISLDETAEFQRLPFSDSIERTLVLTAEVVLTVREPGRDPRAYRLPPDRAVDIGRDATLNTLGFQDPTMSTQHLRVALDEEEIYLVDLGSTNGVLVGERRVDAVRLYPGDRFRAGMIEFEIGLHHASMSRVETA